MDFRPMFGFKSAHSNSIADAYRIIKGHPGQRTCKPADVPHWTKATNISDTVPDYKKVNFRAYRKHTDQPPSLSVEISRSMKGLLQDVPTQTRGLDLSKRLQTAHGRVQAIMTVECAREEGTSLVAQQIMLSHPDVELSVPIRFNQTLLPSSAAGFVFKGQKDNQQKKPIPQTFAIWIRYKDGTDFILPLSVDILGGRRYPAALAGKNRDSTKTLKAGYLVKTKTTWDRGRYSAPIREKFYGYPLLRVTDTVLLHQGHKKSPDIQLDGLKGTVPYIPRLFAPTWALTWSIAPSTRVTTPMLGINNHISGTNRSAEAVWGYYPEGQTRCTVISPLVGDLLSMDCYVQFLQGRESKCPFALVALDFTTHRPAVSVSSLPCAKELVDGMLSCRSCYECTSPRLDDVAVCKFHYNRISPLSEETLATASQFAQTDEVLFNLPFKGHVKTCADLELLLSEDLDLSQVWVTDSEGIGTTNTGFASIQSQIALTNCASGPKHKELSACIKYDGYPTPAAIAAEVLERKAMESENDPHGRASMKWISSATSASHHRASKTYGECNPLPAMSGEFHARMRIDEDKAILVV